MILMSALSAIGTQTLLILIRVIEYYSYVFIIDAVLSWFLKPGNKLRQILIFLTEPLVSLFRPLERRLRRGMNFPISLAHLFAFFFLQILQSVLYRVLFLL
jgi:uncharacterized protein YggT (Ycf19 family)